MMSRRIGHAVLMAIVGLARASIAHADEITVASTEYGLWSRTIATLQIDVGSEGRVVHVVVNDLDGRPASCGTYALAFDAVGARAFAIGSCDPNTGATALALVDRASLFAHDDIPAHPLDVGITASVTHTTSSHGGANSMGSSDVTCSVAVRPFIDDLEHGTRIPLEPPRYRLRTVDQRFTAIPDGAGWTLRGATVGSMEIDFDVIDAARSVVVVHDRAALSCGVMRTEQPPLTTIDSPVPRANNRHPSSIGPTLLGGWGVAVGVAGAVAAVFAYQHDGSVAGSERIAPPVLLATAGVMISGAIIWQLYNVAHSDPLPMQSAVSAAAVPRRPAFRFAGASFGPSPSGAGASAAASFTF